MNDNNFFNVEKEPDKIFKEIFRVAGKKNYKIYILI